MVLAPSSGIFPTRSKLSCLRAWETSAADQFGTRNCCRRKAVSRSGPSWLRGPLSLFDPPTIEADSAMTCSARQVRNVSGRRSMWRPKAQLSPRRTGLAGGLQSWSVFVLSWVNPHAQLEAKHVATCTRRDKKEAPLWWRRPAFDYARRVTAA